MFLPLCDCFDFNNFQAYSKHLLLPKTSSAIEQPALHSCTSYNFLRNVNYIIRLKKLETLFIHFNRLDDVEYLNELNYLTQLKNLWVEGNPFSIEPGYRPQVIKKLQYIRVLDNMPISIEEID